MYRDFSSAKDYEAAVKYAQSLGVLLWWSKDLRKPVLVVSTEGHLIVKTFVKNMISATQ